MTNIKTLETEVAALEIQLAQKQKTLHLLKVAALPWKIGDIVRYKRDGKEYKISGYGNYSIEYGWAKAVGKLKNGSWGRAEKTLFGDFEVIKPAG